MGTSAVQDDPMLRLRYYRETGQLDEAAKYEQYLKETGQHTGTSTALDRRAAARQRTNASEQEAAAIPSYGEQALGGIAALARDIPGAEAVQAGARSLFRGQPYQTALNDIRGAEADNPVSGVNRIVGGTVAAAAMPQRAIGAIAAPVVGGAGYGLLSGALQAEGGLADRAKSAGIQGAVGGLLGHLVPAAASYAKSKVTPTIDVQQLAHDQATAGVDAALYGSSAAEGAAKAASPEVNAAFQNPITQKYVTMIRNAPQYAGADDATVLREAYKLMSRDQGGHATFMQNHGFDAARQLTMDAIGSAKKELLAASETMMPSFPIATKAHALAMRVGEAGQNAADVAQRILTGAHIKGANLPLKSPAQFADEISSMSKDEASSALDMMLGRAKEFRKGATKNPLTAFGLLSAPLKMSPLQPYIAQLAQQAGRTVPGRAAQGVAQGAMTGLLAP